jgi:5-hydroxyisourate hydrolase-like protein (transthyretin family)
MTNRDVTWEHWLAKGGRVLLCCFAIAFAGGGAACSRSDSPAAETEEPESRTEFTDRVENFFEYGPLKAGKQSQFLIHLTDLTDGSPVEKAEVSLLVRTRGTQSTVTESRARIGKVTGIYVAELVVPHAGDYDIEFHIKTDKLDERMALSDFKVE